jgi:hypothetical protein
LLTLAKDLPPAARIVVPAVNTLERRVAGVSVRQLCKQAMICKD